jgi:DNA-binding beta-propeller fold protein YncE
VIKIYKRIIGPKPFPEFFPGDDFAASFQQNCENPARLLLKLDLPALLPKFTRAHIDLVYTEADELRRKGGLFARSQGKQWQEYTPGAHAGQSMSASRELSKPLSPLSLVGFQVIDNCFGCDGWSIVMLWPIEAKSASPWRSEAILASGNLRTPGFDDKQTGVSQRSIVDAQIQPESAGGRLLKKSAEFSANPFRIYRAWVVSRMAEARWWVLGIVLLFVVAMPASFRAPAQAGVPLKLEASMALPGFTGDFDHFALDKKGGRLFLAGEDHKTVEVFDLKANRRIKSISGFGAPHAIFYLPESDHILVTDGDKGFLRILRGKDYSEEARVEGLAGADSARLDAVTETLYVITGGKDVPLDHSFLVAINLRTNEKARELRIESNHVEGLELESSSSRMFINLTDKHAIAVVDRKAMMEIARWPIGSQADNSPMAYDEPHRRLLIVCRKPGTLLVMDSDSGKVITQLPAAERSDDIAFDAASGRIYVPGGDGRIFVFKQNSPDQYELLANITSEPGGKTCLLVPSLARFYVAVSPGETKAAAKVLIYRVLS